MEYLTVSEKWNEKKVRMELSQEQIGLLKDKSKIQTLLSYAEKAFAPYAEYIV